MVFSDLFLILSTLFDILVSLFADVPSAVVRGGHSQILSAVRLVPEHACRQQRHAGITRGAFRVPKLCSVGAVLSIKNSEHSKADLIIKLVS